MNSNNEAGLDNFLTELEFKYQIPEIQIDKVKSILSRAKESTNKVPTVQYYNDTYSDDISSSICVFWETKENYLDVQVFTDGMVEWFYMDRKGTDKSKTKPDGTEFETEINVPDRFFDYLRKFE